ncbi:nuclear distribution protein nudE homolog 1-like isoform X2 [Ornithodoros turicata]|uniref:nuclear distribution protein nudE homolog 1-like isoform X2 n=1 Tax=Ornithodoros turicata TaxID=34597 RepID=UPI003139CD60
MDGDQTPAFSGAEEEASFYKDLAEKYRLKLEETQVELEEFQASSRDLEAELEAQLEQYEKSNAELRSVAAKLQQENESLQERISRVQLESQRQVSDLQAQLADVTASREKMCNYIRELEQSNDDLERAKRATVASLEEFESKLNSAIERNAFLESELDEKEEMGFMVQRLKDEARDLRQELQIQQQHPPTQPFMEKSSNLARKLAKVAPTEQTPNAVDSNRLAVENGMPHKVLSTSSNSGATHCQTPLTPSARISALNIVGDLLRKVGTLINVAMTPSRSRRRDSNSGGDSARLHVLPPARVLNQRLTRQKSGDG